MNNKIVHALLMKFDNPEIVVVSIINDNLVCILSAKNTNDTREWFNINSTKLEKSLLKDGLSWCYVFETIPKEKPAIYMFIGEGLTEESLKDELSNSMKSLPNDRNICYEFGHFAFIDEDKYE